MSTPSLQIFVNSAAGELSLPSPLPNFSEYVMADFGARGDKTAIVVSSPDHTATRTFADLSRDVKSVAHEFRHRLGFVEGDRALLVSPNHADYFTAVHAVLQLGGVCSPANPLYAAREIAMQLKDSGAKVVVTHPLCLQATVGALEETQSSKDVTIVVLGDAVPPEAPAGTLCFDELKDSGKSVDAVAVAADDLAILPYSSGTTGLPKGTMITHKNLVANVQQFIWPEVRFYGDSATILSPLPLFHIYGFTASLNVPLWHGSTLVTLPAFDLPHFLSLVQEYQCTRAHLVPPIILALAKHPLVDQYDISSLKAIVSAAAPLGSEVEAATQARLGESVVIKQGWGMSELSPIGACSPDDHPKTGTSGPPVAGMEYKIVDVATGKALPTGEEGEIVCRGPNVMAGYLNNPEATAECLDSDGWLRTGDVGLVDSDGYITITDRIKELIKYKGFQVPPAELEALLLTHEAVLDAAVISRAHDEAGEVPRAFVVLKPEIDDVSAADLVAWAAERSAPHKKLRGGVHFIDQIPKSAAGKILRRVIKERDVAGEFDMEQVA